ncbi:DUF4124 domain-containing protein [Marinobacter sp.]|uniref:DUF4124 domain-containing protein n=1 Tax=Marinobacter sp. TaxID=50741 RepID=UPI0035650FA5
MNRKILMLTLLLAVVPGIAMSASVYKWTDENGVTHFGDRQPTGATSERVNVRSGTSSDASGSRQSPQERLQNLQEQQAGEEEQRQETAADEARRKQREANCATARSNLEVIDRNARIRVEENGEQRYLSEEEIAEKRAEFERMAEESCGPAEQ